MNLLDLKLKRKKEILLLLADLLAEDLKGAATEDEDCVDSHMEAYVDFLDNLDGYDWFGSEGWRHRVGLD